MERSHEGSFFGLSPAASIWRASSAAYGVGNGIMDMQNVQVVNLRTSPYARQRRFTTWTFCMSIMPFPLRKRAACAPDARRRRQAKETSFVTTLHGTDITIVGADRSYLPVTRYAIEQSDGVTSISNYLKNVTLQEFNIQNPTKSSITL